MGRVKEILRASYDRSAASYDAEFRALQRPKYEAVLGPRAAAVAGLLAAGGRALDLGCGTGLLAEWLAAEGLGARGLVGLDLSHGMAVRARGRGVAAVEGDLDRLPFRDAAFAAVFAFTSLAIVPGSAARALAEVARVLAPGGLLAVSVLRPAWEAGFERELRAAGLVPGARRECGQDHGTLCSRR
jgi:ubiquinone/menaquinone biosynthesis C-methylase UbiE